MKKTLLFSTLIFLLSSCSLSAQLVHQKRFFTENWYVDGQRLTQPEVQLHLDKANKPAAKHYRRAKNAEAWGYAFNVLSVVGTGWILGATFGDGNANTSGGWALMLVGTTGTLISGAVSSSQFDRAVEVYNLSLAPPPPTRK